MNRLNDVRRYIQLGSGGSVSFPFRKKNIKFYDDTALQKIMKIMNSWKRTFLGDAQHPASDDDSAYKLLRKGHEIYGTRFADQEDLFKTFVHGPAHSVARMDG